MPEPPATPITRSGDLWRLGRHRLLCGDSTVPAASSRLLEGIPIDACLTDPPYGVGVDYGEYDDTPENLTLLLQATMPLIRSFPCAAITTGVSWMWLYPKPVWVGAWVHPAGNGRGPWGFLMNNPILFYGADPYLQHGLGSRPDSLVLASDRLGTRGHPVIKPCAVWTWLLERVTPYPGQAVFDPFVGSGTTLIAAEMTGRTAVAMEIAPGYVDVAVQRWQAFTGKPATLDGDNRTFAEIAQARATVPESEP